MSKEKRVVRKSNPSRTKEEMVLDMAQKVRVERMKVLARLIWPFIQDQKSIYDAQTALNATAGFIKQELHSKTSQIVVNQLEIDLKDEKKSPIKVAIENLLGLLQTEKADDSAALLERMGNSLGQFAAAKYMTNPMSTINPDEFIA